MVLKEIIETIPRKYIVIIYRELGKRNLERRVFKCLRLKRE